MVEAGPQNCIVFVGFGDGGRGPQTKDAGASGGWKSEETDSPLELLPGISPDDALILGLLSFRTGSSEVLL